MVFDSVYLIYSLLVGGIPTPLKNMSSPLAMILPNIWTNKTCSKTTKQICHVIIFYLFWSYYDQIPSLTGS